MDAAGAAARVRQLAVCCPVTAVPDRNRRTTVLQGYPEASLHVAGDRDIKEIPMDDVRTIEKTAPLPMSGDEYRYDRFTPRLLFRDLRFGNGAPAPGESLSAIELPTLDGGLIQIGGRRERPLLLVDRSPVR